MQGHVGETSSLRGFRHHSSLTCVQRGSTEVKKVLLAKSQCQGKIRLCMADCSPGCQISPQAGTGLRESFEGRQKTHFILSKPYQGLFCFPFCKIFKKWLFYSCRKAVPMPPTHLNTISARALHNVPFSGGSQGSFELPQCLQFSHSNPDIKPSQQDSVAWRQKNHCEVLVLWGCILSSSPVFISFL